MDQAHQAEKQAGPGAEIHDIYKSWSESIQAVPIPISNSAWEIAMHLYFMASSVVCLRICSVILRKSWKARVYIEVRLTT